MALLHLAGWISRSKLSQGCSSCNNNGRTARTPPRADRTEFDSGSATESLGTSPTADAANGLLDYLTDGKVSLVINTPSGKGARTDEGQIRAAAVQHGVPCITTISAIEAVVVAMEALREEGMEIQAIQDRFVAV